MRLILYGAFAFSGAAGLVYELVWTRYLALMVGHSAHAQILVIATYLGGMGVGALLVADRSDRMLRPLRAYAGAEVALGLMGLLFHPLFLWVSGLAYESLFPALAGTPFVGALKWALAVSLISVQAIILGTTFPLMAAGMLRLVGQRWGGRIAVLYFVNTLGGALAILIAGFYWIEWVGMPGTLALAAGLNILAAVGALGVDRVRAGAPAPLMADSVPARVVSSQSVGLRTRILLGVAFFTAVASFTYEIAWIRMLSLFMGSATHSFEIMLSAFLAGLALGAVLIRRAADDAAEPLRLLAWVQWGMGLAAVATLPIYLFGFSVTAALVSELPATDTGYLIFTGSRYLLALGVMLPSTTLAGMTLPLITATLLRTGSGERAIGWVYGVNTLGSIVGVGLAGLILLPVLGLKGMLWAGAALDIALGVGLLLYAREGRPLFGRPIWLALTGALAGLLLTSMVPMDRTLLTSGVYRYAELPSPAEQPVLFYADGRTATVGAHLVRSLDLVVLTTNGKPDASLGARWLESAISDSLPRAPIVNQDEATQILSPLTALAHAPNARVAAMIGHGSGISGHFVLGSPALERLVTIEIEPRMIDGSRVYYPANRRVFDDPRSVFIMDDARSYFAHSPQRFDLIISEPSNPWVSGTSSLFTIEFYERIHSALSEGGVFAQWIQLYEIEDQLVERVLSAIHSTFPSYRGFLVGDSDLLIVARRDGQLPDPDWSVFDFPDVARDLDHIPLFTEPYLNSMRLFDRETLAPILDSHDHPNSDFHPHLDLEAERTRFKGSRAEGILGLASDRFDLVGALEGTVSDWPPYTEAPVRGISTMRVLARSSWLREALVSGRVSSLPPNPSLERVLVRRTLILDQAGSGRPPVDWYSWLAQVTEVEEELHAGTAGVVDSAFFAPLLDLAQDETAPADVRPWAQFMYGLAAWDFELAAQAADQLISMGVDSEAPIDPALLLDGSVVAYLRVGRVGDARDALERLASTSGRLASDFRIRLLDAYVIAAESGDFPSGS